MSVWLEEERNTDIYDVKWSRSDPLFWSDYSIYNKKTGTLWTCVLLDYKEVTHDDGTWDAVEYDDVFYPYFADDNTYTDEEFNEFLQNLMSKSKEELKEMDIEGDHCRDFIR